MSNVRQLITRASPVEASEVVEAFEKMVAKHGPAKRVSIIVGFEDGLEVWGVNYSTGAEEIGALEIAKACIINEMMEIE